MRDCVSNCKVGPRVESVESPDPIKGLSKTLSEAIDRLSLRVNDLGQRLVFVSRGIGESESGIDPCTATESEHGLFLVDSIRATEKTIRYVDTITELLEI